MSNKNTKRARKKGFSNHAEKLLGKTIYAVHAEPIFKGSCCDTSWDNKNSTKKTRKIYKKATSNSYED